MFLLLLSSCSGLKHNIGYNINTIRFEYSERRQPEYPLEPPFFYFNTQYVVPPSYREMINPNYFDLDVSIRGQRYTDKPKKNDVVITISYGLISIADVTVKDEYVEIEDPETKEKIKEHLFWIESLYGMDVNAVVLQSKTEINKYSLSSRSSPTLYKSKSFGSRKEAMSYWELNKDLLREDFIKAIASHATKSLSSILTKNYGYPIYIMNGILTSIDDKNISETKTFDSQCSGLKYKLSGLDGLTPLKKSEVQKYIDYFESIPQKYSDLEDKSQIRIRYAAYANLSRIYILLDDPDRAFEWAQKIIENGYFASTGNDLAKQATELRNYLQSHPIKSTQFSTDTYFDNSASKR